MLKYTSPEAYAILYSAYNGIDIYVEDSSLVGMYERIFKSLLEEKYLIEAIIPVGKKGDVVAEAQRLSADESRKRFFVVDGDFDWCFEPVEEVKDLYELKAYSIENFAFDREAMIRIAGKISPRLTRAQVEEKLNFDEIMGDVNALMPLMCTYAIARSLGSERMTVRFALNRLLDGKEKFLDLKKVAQRNRTLYRHLCRDHGWRQIKEARIILAEKLANVPNRSMRIISGKYYGIGIIAKHFQNKFSPRMTREHFVCELIEGSALTLDPGFIERINNL